MGNEALELIPRKARLIGYLVFVGLLLAHGAIGAGFIAADVDAPQWLAVSGGVLTFLTTAPLLVAVFNLNAPVSEAEPRRELPAEDSGPAAEASSPQPRQFF